MELEPGTRLGPYEVIASLGSGGMGEVYKARDTRLHRTVALKVIAPERALDPQFRERFEREAHVVSQLNHPNICTLYDVGHHAGRDFLVMEFVEGETLSECIGRGPLGVDEALDIVHGMAQGLSHAHARDILHRDIKPANVMLTDHGFVKLLDFGLAKVQEAVDGSAQTRTGVAIGTLSYMSPEQLLASDQLGPASDVWSLGVVLYEMLAGSRPFSGKNEVAVFKSIISDTPPDIDRIRSDVPGEVSHLVRRCLEKDPQRRFASAAELDAALEAARARTKAAAPPRRTSRARLFATIGVTAVLAAIAIVLGGRAIAANRRVQWARDEALPQIERLIEQDQYVAAFALARQAEPYLGDDARLAALWPVLSVTGVITSDPPGADVFVQGYATVGAEWRLLGKTPLRDIRLPQGAFRFRVQKDGFEPVHLASAITRRFELEPVVLSPIGSLGDMVRVPAGSFPVNLSGFNSENLVQIDAFLIDRTEVTNRAFKEFVDAGGYQRTEWWRGLEASPARFVNGGRAAPASWERGEYPASRADEPVGGVSWYEAAAYCSFRGKRLPTVYHWARAALAPQEITAPLGPSVVPLSNFGGKGPVAVATQGSMGPYGTHDVAGNVREWTWNGSSEGRRWILGGAWNDPDYMFSVPFSLPPGDRSPTNGFRCMQPERDRSIPDALLATVDASSPNYRGARPVSDETYKLLAKQFSYVPSDAEAVFEARDTTQTGSIRERVSLDAGYNGERLTVYVFLPPDGRPPYQAAIYFPALNAFQARVSSSTYLPGDYIVKSGRALIMPVYKGSFERWDPALNLTGEEYFRATRQRLLEWRQDLGRTIDYLATRSDIDTSRIAYYGRSFGASMPLPLLALETRIRAAVLQSAGFTYRVLPAEMDAVNYVPRIKMPVLMLTGRHDYVFPYHTSQQPLFELLGTPAADKRHIVYEAGHDFLPRSQVIREILAWLDRHLGPVSSRS